MKKPDAKSRILSKAAALFQRRGYSEVGINEIIEESCTAKATFYHHFPSKRALCEAWLEEIHERSTTMLAELLEAPVDPVSKVETYFGYLGQFLQSNDFRGCPYTNTAVVAPEEESLVARIQEHKCGMRGFFRKLGQEMAANEEAANALGDSLFLLYSGATTEAQNLRDLWPVEVARQTAVELCQAAKS